MSRLFYILKYSLFHLIRGAAVFFMLLLRVAELYREIKGESGWTITKFLQGKYIRLPV